MGSANGMDFARLRRACQLRFRVFLSGDEVVKCVVKLVALHIPLDVHYLGLELSGFR